MGTFGLNITDPTILEKLAKLAKTTPESLAQVAVEKFGLEEAASWDSSGGAPSREVMAALTAAPWVPHFLLDINVGNKIAAYLRLAGMEVTGVIQTGLNHNTPDKDIFCHAVKNQMVIVTFDHDFLTSDQLDHASSRGVIVLTHVDPIPGRPASSARVKAALDHIIQRLPRNGWKIAYYGETDVHLFPGKPERNVERTYDVSFRHSRYFDPTP